MKNILIIGGGLAGLSAAYNLTNLNKSFTLFEKENQLGGLCRSVKSNGFNYDHTGHLLHFSDKNIESMVKGLLGKNLALKERKSFIFFKDKYIDYPFQQNLFNLPLKVKKECLFGYLEIFFRDKDGLEDKNLSFKEWSIKNFGEGISKYFMLPYNEKLWKVKSTDMTTTWMKGYVPKPNLEEVLNGTFEAKKESVGYNATFYYPKKGGIQSLPDAIAKNIDKKNIKMSNQIKSINLKNKILIDGNGEKFKYDVIINSAPLKNIILDIIEDAPKDIKSCAKKLKSNIVLNINLGINKDLDSKHWIYFPEDKFVFYRVGFSSNFSKQLCPKNCSSIYTEISLDEDFDLTDEVIEAYKNKVIKDLIKAKILKSKLEIIDVTALKIKPAYVSYDFDRDENVVKLLDYLRANSIIPVGRFGLWEYSDMEHAILQGLDASLIAIK